MTQLRISMRYNPSFKKSNNIKAHPFHLVSPSPWPLYMSSTLFATTLSGVLTFHSFTGASRVLYTSLISVVYSMCLWFNDVIYEATHLGNHTLAVQKWINMGVSSFIISEALFFLAIFVSFLTEPNLTEGLIEVLVFFVIIRITCNICFPFLIFNIIYQMCLLIERVINPIIYYMCLLIRRGINYLDNYFSTVIYLLDNCFLIVEPLNNVGRALFTFYFALFIMLTSELLILYGFIVTLRVLYAWAVSLYNKYWFIVKYHIIIGEISPAFHITVLFFIWIITRSGDRMLDDFFIYTNGLQPGGNFFNSGSGGDPSGGSNPQPNNPNPPYVANPEQVRDRNRHWLEITNTPERIQGHFIARKLDNGQIGITLKNLDRFSKEDAKASLETLRRGLLSWSYVSEEKFKYPGRYNRTGVVLVLAGFSPKWEVEGDYGGVYIPNIFQNTDSFITNESNIIRENSEGYVFVRGSLTSQISRNTLRDISTR